MSGATTQALPEPELAGSASNDSLPLPRARHPVKIPVEVNQAVAVGAHANLRGLHEHDRVRADFVEKPYNSQQMLERIQRAMKLASQRHAKHMRQFELRERINSLTSREKEVLHGLIEGKPSKVIAADLSISVTVDVHRASIKEKLGASSIPTLVRRVPEVWSPSDEQPE